MPKLQEKEQAAMFSDNRKTRNSKINWWEKTCHWLNSRIEVLVGREAAHAHTSGDCAVYDLKIDMH